MIMLFLVSYDPMTSPSLCYDLEVSYTCIKDLSSASRAIVRRSQFNTGCTLCSDHTLTQLVKYPLSHYRTIIYCTIDDIFKLPANNGRRLLLKDRHSIMITSYHTHLFYIVAIIPNQAFHQHNKRAWRTTWGNRFFNHVYHGYHERRLYIFSEGGKGLCLKGTDLAFNVRKYYSFSDSNLKYIHSMI